MVSNQSPQSPMIQSVTIPPIPPASTSPLPTNKTYWFFIALIIILSGVASYFGYEYSQLKTQLNTQLSSSTPTPIVENSKIDEDITLTWETYTNTVFNYSFKYPKEFRLIQESNDNIRVTSNLPPDPNCKGGGCNLEIQKLTIYFEHLDNPEEDKLSLDEFAQTRRSSLLNINEDQTNISILNKYQYEMRYFEGITEGFHHTYLLKLNPNTSFVITALFPSKDEAPIYSQLENQIISSFQLIK